jgi:hypothetical protein
VTLSGLLLAHGGGHAAAARPRTRRRSASPTGGLSVVVADVDDAGFVDIVIVGHL